MGQVAAVALERLHRLERRLPVAGQAEVVAVDVDGVRQIELVAGGSTKFVMICRGVTSKCVTASSRPWTLPPRRLFQTSTPPGLTSLAA